MRLVREAIESNRLNPPNPMMKAPSYLMCVAVKSKF